MNKKVIMQQVLRVLEPHIWDALLTENLDEFVQDIAVEIRARQEKAISEAARMEAITAAEYADAVNTPDDQGV